MMEHFGSFLRLLLVFPVVGFINLYACQADSTSFVFPQITEQNDTRTSTYLFTMRQKQQTHHWESPAATSTLNHQHNNVNGITSGSRFLESSQALPLAPFSDVSLGAHQSTQQQQNLISEDVADSIAKSVLRFALEVGSQLSENAYFSKSEVFSPLSIMTALSLLFAGAKGNSYQQLSKIFDLVDAQLLHKEFGDLLQDVEQQDLRALHHRNNAKWRDTPVHYNIRASSPQKQNEPIEHIIKVANGLFTQMGYNLNVNYRDVIQTIYRSELTQLDYRINYEAARQHINAWVSQKTYGKIPNIIRNAIPTSTNMILASVLYFKGFWENTFFESATALDNFYPEGENKPAIKVKMMVTGGVFPFYDSEELNCRIIGFPYKGNLTTMYVLQPKQSSRANLKSFQSTITPELIDGMISKMAYRTAVVAFPKMHIERQLNMKDILRNFGVTDIFSSSASDLSLISGVPSLSASTFSRATARPMHAATQKYASRHEIMDRFNEAPIFFSSRFGNIGNDTKINSTAEKATSDRNAANKTLNNIPEPERNSTETVVPSVANKTTDSISRKKRQVFSNNNPLSLLEAERLVSSSLKSDLYVEDILHKVDFEVNEQGTEAAAATLTVLRRSGTDIIFRAETPFILLIRHDPSKLVLFYSIVNEPES